MGYRVLDGGLGPRDLQLDLVLHRKPTGGGELKASALSVEDRQDSAFADLIVRLPGIGLGGAARKDSEVCHSQSLPWRSERLTRSEAVL